MNDCPNCEIGKLVNGKCPRCDWQVPKAGMSPVVHKAWESPADPEPLTEEQRAELKEALSNLYVKFGAPVEKIRKTTLEQVVTRCSLCSVGKFVHSGTRYCATCYGKL